MDWSRVAQEILNGFIYGLPLLDIERKIKNGSSLTEAEVDLWNAHLSLQYSRQQTAIDKAVIQHLEAIDRLLEQKSAGELDAKRDIQARALASARRMLHLAG
ncbi:MAG: hypothetical protein V1767_03570 [Chloroflexota bacterium]